MNTKTLLRLKNKPLLAEGTAFSAAVYSLPAEKAVFSQPQT